MQEMPRQDREIEAVLPGVYAGQQWGEMLRPPESVGGASDEITCPAGAAKTAETTPIQEYSEPAAAKNPAPKLPLTITERPTRYFVMEPGGRFVVPGNPLGKDQLEAGRLYTPIQERIIEHFPPDRQGLDIDRVRGFVGQLGLHEVPTLELWDDKRKALATMRGNWVGDGGTYYDNAIHTSYVFRNNRLEALNGTAYTDSLRAATQAAGNSAAPAYTAVRQGDDARFHVSRTGQSIFTNTNKRHGDLLEAGFAEHIRGRYVAEELGQPWGFTDLHGEPRPFVAADIGWSNNIAPISPQYLIRQDFGVADHGYYDSYAATVIDMLTAKDPALGDAFLEARRSVDGLREVAGRIEAIQKGLYRKLRDDYPSFGMYPEAGRYVADLLGIAYRTPAQPRSEHERCTVSLDGYRLAEPLTVPVVAQPQASVLDRPVHPLVRLENGRLRPDDHPSPGRPLLNIQDEFIRGKLLTLFPDNPEGLDIAGTADFIRSLGLAAVMPTVHIWQEERTKMVDFLTTHRIIEPDTEFVGITLNVLNTVVLTRDPIYEAYNGTHYTDALRVHELAHGSTQHNVIYPVREEHETSATDVIRRGGQRIFGNGRTGYTGYFTEEAVSDHIRGRYMTEKLGLEYGFAGTPPSAKQPYTTVNYGGKGRFVVPELAKYAVQIDETRIRYSAASYAGAAMDILVGRDRGLGQAVIDARSSVEGLREVARRIERIQPGLYTRLRDEQSFVKGLLTVLQALGREPV